MKSDNDTTTRVLRARHRVLTTTVLATAPIDRGGRHISQADAFHHESFSFLIPAVSRSGDGRPLTPATAQPLSVEHSAREHTGVGMKRKANNDDGQKLASGTPTAQERKQAVTSAEAAATEAAPIALTENGGGPSKRGKRFVPKWSDETDRVLRKALTKHGWGCWKRIAESGKLVPQITPKMISNRAKALGLTRSMFLTPLSNTGATSAVPVANSTTPIAATTTTATATATATATVAPASTIVNPPVARAADKDSSGVTGAQTPSTATVAVQSTEGVVTSETAQRAPIQ